MPQIVRRVSVALRQSIYSSSIKCFFIFYILVGLPTGFQGRFLPIFFRSHGMSLARVGLYRLLVLPWLLKGMWTAYIGRDTNVRLWLNTSLLGLVLLCMISAYISPDATISVAVILFAFNLITSVQDTAIDALLMDAFTPSQLLMGNVAQAVGERIGSVISGGVFAWYIEFLTWTSVFYLMGAMYAGGLLTSYFLLPDLQSGRASSSSSLARLQIAEDSDANAAPVQRVSITDEAKTFFSHASVWMILFVLFYKIGEAGVFNLFPLFLVDQNIEASEIGFWLGIVGQSVSILGSVSTVCFTFRSLIAPLTVLIVFRTICVCLTWIAVVFWKANPKLAYATGVSCTVLLSLAGGAMTTCTQTLLMQLSQRAPRHLRSKMYAIYSFGELLAKLLFSAAVGALAEATSYQFSFCFFALASAVIVPYMWLAPPQVYVPMT